MRESEGCEEGKEGVGAGENGVKEKQGGCTDGNVVDREKKTTTTVHGVVELAAHGGEYDATMASLVVFETTYSQEEAAAAQ